MAQPVEQRVQLVQVLLVSFFDYLPDPPTSTGLISRSALPGPAPGKRVPCGYCRRNGRVRLRRGSRICPVCEGAGWRIRRKLNPSHPEYEQAYDEYTGEPVEADETQHPHAMTRSQLDRALERLESWEQGERFGWERERKLYERQGSYLQLGIALDRLQDRWPPGHQAIRRHYWRGILIEPSETTQRLTGIAEEWLAREMRGEIRVPIWLVEEEADRKRETVASLAAQGLSAGQIARRLRMPKLKVQRTLRSFTLTAEVVTGASPRGRT